MKRSRSRLTRAKWRWRLIGAKWRWRVRWFVASRGGRRDWLTGLGTPRQFMRDLEGLSARGGALLYVGMPDMKFVELTYGDRDPILCGAGARIRASAGANRVYRIGGDYRFRGDQFAVVMAGASGAEAHELAERIVEALDAPITVRSARPGDPPSVVPVRVGIGCATAPADGTSAPALIEAASRALATARDRQFEQPWSQQVSIIAPASAGSGLNDEGGQQPRPDDDVDTGYPMRREP